MTPILVCALCAAVPVPAATPLSLEVPPLEPPAAEIARSDGAPDVRTVLAGVTPVERSDGSGGGEGDHGSQMGPMWIVMGVMMAAMVVGAGFYMMRGQTASAVSLVPAAAPASFALPPPPHRPGGS